MDNEIYAIFCVASCPPMKSLIMKSNSISVSLICARRKCNHARFFLSKHTRNSSRFCDLTSFCVFSRPWTSDIGMDNETNEDLRNILRRLLSANEVLDHETAITKLVDEHTTPLFVKIATKIFEAVESIHENITLDEILPSLSLVATVVFILVGGYIMSYLVKMEEESVRKQLGAKGLKVDRKSGKVVPELKVHELRAETYNGMVRLLKPGCRTIVLIVDRESKEKLVPKFYKLAWPYRRNKTLMFGFLYIEKGMY